MEPLATTQRLFILRDVSSLIDNFFMSNPDLWSSLTAYSASVWVLKIATTEFFFSSMMHLPPYDGFVIELLYSLILDKDEPLHPLR